MHAQSFLFLLCPLGLRSGVELGLGNRVRVRVRARVQGIVYGLGLVLGQGLVFILC